MSEHSQAQEQQGQQLPSSQRTGRTFWEWLTNQTPTYPPSQPVAPPVDQDRFIVEFQAVAEQLQGLDETLTARFEDLEKQVKRSGREQYRANSLAETQQEQTRETLELLRSESERYQEQLQEACDVARLEVLQELLPTLDALDEALRSGRALLANHPLQAAPAKPALPVTDQVVRSRLHTVWHWMERRVVPKQQVQLQQAAEAVQPQVSADTLRSAMESWLVGLTYIRQRLLDLLASAGIVPIVAEGQPFDPQYHVVFDVAEASAASPPGTVAAELRCGYLIGERVLRHAEVVVTRDNLSGR